MGEAVWAVCMIVLIIGAWIWAGIQAGTTELSVDTKRGVPYCRGCGRQVSYRRDYCRSCGLSLRVPRQPEQANPARDALLREEWRKAQERDAEQYARMAELSAQREAERLAARAALRAERDDAYRARGIEPGPWAWFKALPEVTQAILLGLVFAIPAAALAVAIFAPRSTAPPIPPAPTQVQPARPVAEQAKAPIPF